jgi:hypothetical protein
MKPRGKLGGLLEVGGLPTKRANHSLIKKTMIKSYGTRDSRVVTDCNGENKLMTANCLRQEDDDDGLSNDEKRHE